MKKIGNWQYIFLTVLLLLSFCFPSMVVNAESLTNFTDIQDHWAAKQINDWTNKSLVGGYPDGTFKPNNNITRAEFIALVNRAFGYKEAVPLNFSDVSENDWFAAEIAQAQAVGYIGGYPDGTVKPNNPISRQEVAAILAKILKPKSMQFNLALKFTDSATIPEWSMLAINAIVNNGYMGGYPDNTFKPAQPITRAESISVLARAVGALYHQVGIYDSAETLTGNVTINSSGITLKNAVITGDLYLTEGIGTGNVTLDNVQVRGTTKVRGGGANSIIIKDSNLGSVLVDVSARHKVRLLAQGATTIGTVEARTGVKLEEQNLTGSGFGNVIILAPRNAKTELVGDFEEIDVETPKTKIELQQGTIQKITLAPAIQGTSINLAPKTTVDTFTTHSAATVTGEGTIRTANINVNGVELATEPKLTLAIAEGVEALVAGKIREGKKPTAPPGGGGGGGGGGGDTTVAVSGISVEPTELTLTVGATGTIKATVEPSKATNKKVNWTTSDANIATVDKNGKVTAVKGGIVIITATSDANSSKKATCEVTVLTVVKEGEPVTFDNGAEISELPAGTKIAATVVEPPTVEGVETAGKAMKFTFEGEVPDEGVLLKLPTTSDEAGLSYFNKERKKWELQTGSKVIIEDNKKFVQAQVYHFSIYGPVVKSAQLVADSITAIEKPEKDATSLTLPEVPEGFEVKIKTSSNDKVIDLDGTITPPSEETTVEIVLEVTKGDASADTEKINVVVPGKTMEIPVSAISVEGVAKVGETLTAKVTPEKATVTYKWMRADAEDGEYVAIAGATDKTYTLSEADAGKWIKVEVKGTGNYTGTKSKVVGLVEEVEEPIETIEAIIDYNAVWNESRGTWYIKVTVPDENLDAGSVKSIHAITEAGVDLDEPRELTPDTDTVMWFGVAKGDGEVTLKRDGKYAYKVVRQDDSEYIFSFDYAANKVQGEINLVQAALQAVNVAEDRNALKEVIEEKAAILGLDLTDYNTLIDDRKPSVSSDLLSNKPEDGYDLATLQEYFNAIVATRHATQASMDKVNNAKSIADLDGISWVTDLLAQFEAADEVYDYHSGIALSEKIATLQGLVDRYNALPEANQEAALEAVLAEAPYARSQATTEALDAALAEQEGIIGEVGEALQAVNVAEDRNALKEVIEEKAAILGLDLTDYNTLIDDRKPSVSSDLLSNKPEDGYDLATLQEYFNAIVATRHATQASMDKVNNAKSIADLDGISWVTDLLAQFEAADEVYDYHSGIALSEKIATLQGLVDRYNALPEANQEAALEAVLAEAPYARSQATTEALDAALAEQEGIIGEVGEALQAVNVAEDRNALKEVIEEKAAILGLDLTDYNTLIDDRKPSVSSDLLSNKPEDGYDLATLQEYFNAIVATRHATQASMDKVNNAKSIADLDGISWVTDLLAQFEAADEVYDYHSGIALSEKIATLQGLVDRYNALPEANQEAALEAVLAEAPYARSQATTEALDAALAEQEGIIGEVGEALQAVNVAEDRNALKEVIEEKAAILGLDLTDYNTLIDDRKPSVSSDLLSNKPEDGYDLATLQEYFNAIVATRHATQASMDKVNNAKSIADLDGISWVTDLLAQFEAADEVYDYHSGIALSEKISTLQDLVERYNSLDEAGQAAVLQKLLDKRPKDGYARSQATTDALAEALTEVEAEQDAIAQALAAVNDYLTPANYNYAGAPDALEGHLAVLGLDVGEDSAYAALDKTAIGGKNRKTAVFYDLNQNKPDEGYDLATLTTYFNDMVATRLVTEESMDLVNNAKDIEDLEGISFVTMLLDRFGAVSYQTHSGIPVEEKIATLQGLVERYNSLDEAGQAAVLQKLLDKRPKDGYARSQATTDALAEALTEVEAEPVASTYKFSYEVPADVVAGQEVVVPVTFETDGEPGDIGYDGVRFKFAAEGPEGATVTFKAVDSNNDEYTFTNEGYWGPPGGFDLPAQYSATTEWTLVFSEAGDYTITFSLIDADTEEVIAGITDSVTIEVEKPVEPSKPVLEVTGPDEEVSADAENFTVTFVATHDKELAYLEIDHNLGKHGELPAGVDILPEFKLYPDAANPWGSEQAAQEAEDYGVSATYDAANTTWTVTFGGEALAKIRSLTAQYTDNEFKIYSLVCDVDGVKSGSMYDGTYETTIVTLVDPLQEVIDGYSISVSYEAGTITAEFDKYLTELPAGLEGYKIDVLITLGAALPEGTEIEVRYNDGDPLPLQDNWRDNFNEANQNWLGEGILDIGGAKPFVGGEPGKWTITISGNEEDINTTVKIESAISNDKFETWTVIADAQVDVVLAAEKKEYHTYKFEIKDLADKYIVSEGLANPSDENFEGLTPVKLSIVVDENKDKAYEGKVRVAPVGANGLQLWAKDSQGKWYDINVTGWGPPEGFVINPELVTPVYVIVTEAFDETVTLSLVDVTGDYGAEDNIIISQEVAVKAVVDEQAQALAAVNDYLTPANYDYAGAPDALEGHLTVLGLDVGEDSDYAALDKTAIGGKNRKTAVFYDLNQNKPDEGYDLATLTTYFNAMVATRLVTEESMDLVNNAKDIEDLEGISFVTMLLDRFGAVSYQTHSGIPVEEKIATLQGLVERYNSLDEAGQAAVLQKLLDKRPEDGYARSQATTDALAEALTEVEQDALAAVNDYLTPESYNYSGAPEALEEHLATLGLDVGEDSDYAALDKTATGGKNRKTAVFYDLNNNKPAEGYDLSTLTSYFNDIVATRLVTEKSMDLVNNAQTIEDLEGISFVTMLLDRFRAVSYQTHSGIPVGEKIATLQGLVDRYNSLGEAGQAAVLQKLLDKRPEDGYARSQATTDALAEALTEVEQDALAAVNDYLTPESYNYSGAPEALEEHLATLGLDVGEDSDYAALDKTATGGKNRKTAVFYDLNNNKPAEGYDLATLTTYFNAIVATRLVTEESMDLVNNAQTIEDLEGISFVTMLLDRFRDVSYQTHSDILVTEKVSTLQGLVTRYNELSSDADRDAVLQKLLNKRPEGGYVRSQATTDALAVALTEVEEGAAINDRLAITSVSIVDNKAYASTAADGGTVRVLGYGVGINLDAKSEGKTVNDTTSIVVELYKGETLLGQQTLNETGRSKHGDKSAISGTIDAGGEYVATSWNNSWSAGIADIPDKAIATVQYSDGTAIAEKAVSLSDDVTKIFYAAEAVHALFEDVFAETLALAEGVTQGDIDTAQTLVDEVTIKTNENKVVLGELITQAQALLAGEANVTNTTQSKGYETHSGSNR